MPTLKEQSDRVESEIRRLEEMGGSLTGKAKEYRDSAVARFPVVFVLLSAFGLVATFYGFEKVIDNIKFFADNPEMILVVGLAILTFTGTLYKKLK